MKASLIAALSILLGVASSSPATVYFEEWFTSGCPGDALEAGTLTNGFCTVAEQFPGKSIKIVPTSPCPSGTTPQIKISSTNDCSDPNPELTVGATGECIEIDFDPSALVFNCV